MNFFDGLSEPGTVNGILTIFGASLAIYGFSSEEVTNIVGYAGSALTGIMGLVNTFRKRDKPAS
jgi:hypothetical protein